MFEHITEFWGKRDERIIKYPLMGQLPPTIAISCCYLLFIKVIGPSLMMNRKPFELRWLMITYNALLVVFNGWLSFNYFYYAWFNNYSWRCQNRDTTNSSENLMLVRTGYGFFLSKFLELFDTVFFVLRKKDSQVNFLHVFHHSVLPISAWFGTSYGTTGSSTLFPALNTFVHVWMYSYYGLSAIGPSIQKYLWWKKYLTTLQMIQFTIMIVFYTQVIFFPPKGCQVTGLEVSLCVGQALIFLALFVHFYFSVYTKKPANKYRLVSSDGAKKHTNGLEKKGA